MPAAGASSALNDADLPYEEDLLRNPYNLGAWMKYLDIKAKASYTVRFQLYERALKMLPGSYKLWYRYLKERRKAVRGFSPIDPARKEVNHVFDRALVFMHKMPRIWIDYVKFITKQRMITQTRRTFDAALLSLPITQHHRIWPLYIAFIKSHDIPETTVRVYRRHLKLDPDGAEDYIDYLISIDRLDDAAVKLADVVNRDKFVSKKNRSNHELWQWLCELISKNPGKITSLRVDAIIRGGLRRFTDMVGTLWNALADYYIRQGNFEKARDIYEEAVLTVSTVRDFSQVFDSYAQFEESSLNMALESLGDMPDDDQQIDAEIRMARFEELMDRRPLLLSSVLIRQNPNNVEEWQKRVALFDTNPEKKAETFTDAVSTIDPKQAQGDLHELWMSFAKMYEEQGDISQARIVFDKAVQVDYLKVEHLASVWCAYGEMEIDHKNYKQALYLMSQATTPSKDHGVSANYRDGNLPTQARVHKSLKLWSFYADLEESLGSFASCKAVYDRILELRIATPQTVLNFAAFLEEHNYFENAFTAYERGLALFKWPAVFEIWDVYLVKFIERYEGTKLERTRELFEQCVADVSGKFAKRIYLLYAQFEEKYGLARHAMKVYERATKGVAKGERNEVWNIYIERTSATFGVTYTRGLYEKAITELPDREARDMCIRFANLERKLGEIDRARGIYQHCSQLCDPRTNEKYWQTWNDFEVRHGNEDTFRDMLRIKRSVAASYNVAVNFAASMAGTVGEAADAAESRDDMAMLEAQATELAKKQIVDTFAKEGGGAIESDANANKDEIDIDDDDDDDDDEPKEAVGKKMIPDEVFGGIARPDVEEVEEEAALGAKDRFKKAQQG